LYATRSLPLPSDEQNILPSDEQNILVETFPLRVNEEEVVLQNNHTDYGDMGLYFSFIYLQTVSNLL